MPVTFNQILADRAEMTLAGDGGDLHLTYRPRSVTPRVLKAMLLLEHLGSETPNDQTLAAMDSVSDQLAGLLIDWDMEYPGPDGQPNGVKVPPTREGLEDVDYLVQATILRAIQDHMQHSKASGRKSLKR